MNDKKTCIYENYSSEGGGCSCRASDFVRKMVPVAGGSGGSGGSVYSEIEKMKNSEIIERIEEVRDYFVAFGSYGVSIIMLNRLIQKLKKNQIKEQAENFDFPEAMRRLSEGKVVFRDDLIYKLNDGVLSIESKNLIFKCETYGSLKFNRFPLIDKEAIEAKDWQEYEAPKAAPESETFGWGKAYELMKEGKKVTCPDISYSEEYPYDKLKALYLYLDKGVIMIRMEPPASACRNSINTSVYWRATKSQLDSKEWRIYND